MDCACCGVPVGGEKNYALFALKREPRQVAICKACMMLGMKAPTGSIVANKEVVSPPKLAFPYKADRAAFCKVARDEGWLTQGIPGDAEIIEAHWKQALINNYFVPGEGWKKNMHRHPLDCFRRSCASIRDNYPAWLELKVGK